MTNTEYAQPDPVYANTDMTDAELGTLVRSMLAFVEPGHWVNVTMGECDISGKGKQLVAPMEHLGTISRPDR